MTLRLFCSNKLALLLSSDVWVLEKVIRLCTNCVYCFLARLRREYDHGDSMALVICCYLCSK